MIRNERKQHTYIVYLVRFKITYFEEESSSPIQYMIRVIQIGYKKISLKADKEQILISTHFSSHPHSH